MSTTTQRRPTYMPLGKPPLDGPQVYITVPSLSHLRTVFYELLTRRYPFASLDATGFPLDVTMVIYQVGRGSRQDITSRDAPKKIKVYCSVPPPPSPITPPPSLSLGPHLGMLAAGPKETYSILYYMGHNH